jgi:hypothetical protein
MIGHSRMKSQRATKGNLLPRESLFAAPHSGDNQSMGNPLARYADAKAVIAIFSPASYSTRCRELGLSQPLDG